jgi:hypothetical protein
LETDDSGSAKDIADVYEEVRVGTMAVNSNNVERITGNKPRSIEQYAIENQDAIKSTIERVSASSN